MRRYLQTLSDECESIAKLAGEGRDANISEDVVYLATIARTAASVGVDPRLLLPVEFVTTAQACASTLGYAIPAYRKQAELSRREAETARYYAQQAHEGAQSDPTPDLREKSDDNGGV